MIKSIVIKLGNGNLKDGFTEIIIQIFKGSNIFQKQLTASLPSAQNLDLQGLYEDWNLTYENLQKHLRLERLSNPNEDINHDDDDDDDDDDFGVKEGDIVNELSINLDDLTKLLEFRVKEYFNSPELAKRIPELKKELGKDCQEIRVIFESKDEILRKLPLHCWDFFADFPQAELSLSPIEYTNPQPLPRERKKVRILMILGNSEGINVEQFEQELKVIEKEQDDVEIVFKDKPNKQDKQEFNQLLADEIGWDILIFAGHSQTEKARGVLFINEEKEDNKITIKELEDALKTAIKNGLSLAIFNSCDGLGLANDLAKLNLPEIIVMREPVAQKVALEFFKYFLEHFIRQRKGLYLAFKEAKKPFKKLENEFPCASGLPIICQNPTVEPPSWIYLGGIPPCPYRGLFAFQEDDAPLFFGRETFIQELLIAINNQPLVAVIGASGSGKSSAVFAGFIPLWRQIFTDNLPHQVISFRPASPNNDNPWQNLADVLVDFEVLVSQKSELENISNDDLIPPNQYCSVKERSNVVSVSSSRT